MEKNTNLLAEASLLGASIVKCDNQKCETCPNESYDCQKLICSGGHVCIWK